MRTEGFVEVQDGKLWFELAGAGSPIVLIHAGIADSRMWDPQVTVLASQGWRVLRYDVRGYRKSKGGIGLKPHWHDLLKLLAALNIGEAAMVGSSLGAAIAIDFTLENPAMVRSLVLVSPGLGGYDWQPSIKRYGAAIQEAARADDIDRIVEEHLRLWVDGRSRKPTSLDSSVRELARDMLHGAIAVEDGAQMEGLAIGRLPEIQKPTLILAGAEDVPDVLAIAGLLEHGIQGATKVVLPDAAHLLNMERPEAFNELVLGFLAGDHPPTTRPMPESPPWRRHWDQALSLQEEWTAIATDWITWARKPGHDSYWRFHRDRFLELLPTPPLDVVDLGCGEGRLSRDLTALGYKTVGIDASPLMIAAAREADPGGRYDVANAFDTGLAGASVDVVAAFMSLQDIDDMPAAVSEAARLLRPGGWFCISIVHPLSSAGGFESLAPDSAFRLQGPYLEERKYVDEGGRDGLRMRFASYHRPLGAYFAALESQGFVIDRLREVTVDSESVEARRDRQRWYGVPLFLHLRASRPQ